jgi:cation diffusion facilitator CzcD-associated flavoprotein CzcO
MTARPDVQIAIIGAGFSGLGMAARLKKEGRHDFVVVDRADEVGGTWEANTYPGCQCDVPSHLYSLSFAPNPEWSRTYSKQPEIWEYLKKVADDHGLRPHLRLGTSLQGAEWDEDAGFWRLDTSAGPITAKVVISALGALSEPSLPDIPGIAEFPGTIFHSARWNHDHDLTGERVAVIGSGASAIQFVPQIQSKVGQMHVFQRTPPWITPHSDRPITPIERAIYRRFPAIQRAVRSGIYWSREFLVLGLVFNKAFLKIPQALAERHLKHQVSDPDLRAKVTPDYTIGCKRILPSNKWYPALSKPNVELIPSGLAEIRGSTVVAADGTEREVDTIIMGTGFYVTEMPWAEHVKGKGGTSLDQAWKGSPQAYLGTAIAGFPNQFVLLGPNTGLGHTSVVYMIEAQIHYVMEALKRMESAGLDTVDVRPEVEQAFVDEIEKRMQGTVWNSGGCKSWYLDRNGRNTTLWPEFTWRYRLRTRRFDEGDYVITRAEEQPQEAPEPALT